MALQFDIHGCLIPYQDIPTNSWEVYEHLVEAFPKSEKRQVLYDTLIAYCDRLKTILCDESMEDIYSDNITIWIDGSFVTQKENPNDIDLVIFVDAEFFKQNEALLSQLKCSCSQPKLSEFPSIDAYIVETYPLNHPKYDIYHSDYLYWLSFFGKNRKGRKKGILSLSLCEFDAIRPDILFEVITTKIE